MKNKGQENKCCESYLKKHKGFCSDCPKIDGKDKDDKKKLLKELKKVAKKLKEKKKQKKKEKKKKKEAKKNKSKK